MWQNDTEKYLFANPELVEALKNPARIFNQDETAVQVRKTSWILLEIISTHLFRLVPLLKGFWQRRI